VFILAKFRQKREIQNFKKSDLECFQLTEVRKQNFKKSSDLYI
jgi:hypothetical protein